MAVSVPQISMLCAESWLAAVAFVIALGSQACPRLGRLHFVSFVARYVLGPFASYLYPINGSQKQVRASAK